MSAPSSTPDKGLVLIIGGSSGMGKAAAVACINAGHTALIAGRDEAKLAAAKKEIEQTVGWEGAVTTAAVDLADDDSCAAFFASLPSGIIKHLVVTVGASAGVSSILGSEGFKGLRKQFDMKFFAQMAAVSRGAPLLADGGSIVLVSGALAKRPGKGSTALATANAALEAAVKGLANDLGPRLRINVVSPGLVDTEIWDKMPAERKAGMLAGFGASVPCGRAGQPGDIGAAVLFLLSNGWVTGTTLDVDGGAAVRA